MPFWMLRRQWVTLSTHCQALLQSKQGFHFAASSPCSRAMGRSWKERGFWKLVKWQEGVSIGVWKRTHWNLILCYHKHHFPFQPPYLKTLLFTFPQDLLSKESSGEVCRVTVSGFGTAFVMEWTRCSRIEDHGWCTPLGRSLPSSSQKHLSWRSTLQPNQVQSSSPDFRAMYSLFLQWNLLPSLCLGTVHHLLC